MLRPYSQQITALDNRFTPDPKRVVAALSPPSSGWIDGTRTALGISLFQLITRLPIQMSALSRLQEAEREGTITLNKLRMVAEALDCELVYGFVPNTSFAAIAEANLAKINRGRSQKRTRPLTPIDE